MPTYTTKIYSPRWGHTDEYTFEFTREKMKISVLASTAICIWVEDRDPRWEGDLESILNNDSIYPPAILPRLYEHLWVSWRNGEINEGEVDAELQAVTEWLNEITARTPRTNFWNSYF